RQRAIPSGLLRSAPSAAPALVGAIAVLVLPTLVPRPTDGPTGHFLAVQGNVPRAGLDFNAERRLVLDNHARATLQVAESVKAGSRPRPDLVVWPENASDIDPLRNPDAAARISEAADAIKAPILVGALNRTGENGVLNVGLVWQ